MMATPTLFTFVLLNVIFLFAECGLGAPQDDWRGQPEVQQPLDNAPVPSHLNLPFPSGRGQGFPMLFTQKTSTLLSEALHMLRKVDDNKERRWLEAFIHRLGSLAADLEESNSRNSPKAVPPTESHAAFTLPVKTTGKVQTKFHVTSAHINDVLPANEGVLSRQVVTRPGLRKVEDDLVQQLRDQKDLRQKVSGVESHVTYHTRPLETTSSQAVTLPTTPLHSSNKIETLKATETQRKTLLSKLLMEMNDLRRLGVQEKEVMNSLKFDNHHVADFTNPEFVLDQKHNSLEEANEFEIEEDTADEEDEIEGAAAGAIEEEDNRESRTAAPSLQKVMKVSTEGLSHHLMQQRQQIQLSPPQPTMSDEMERQLRSGRIVVLSDSLVHTNFRPPSNNRRNSKPLPTKSTSSISHTTTGKVGIANISQYLRESIKH